MQMETGAARGEGERERGKERKGVQVVPFVLGSVPFVI
jgi:hypothetical protein